MSTFQTTSNHNLGFRNLSKSNLSQNGNLPHIWERDKNEKYWNHHLVLVKVVHGNPNSLWWMWTMCSDSISWLLHFKFIVTSLSCWKNANLDASNNEFISVVGNIVGYDWKELHQPLKTTTCWWMKRLSWKQWSCQLPRKNHGYSESIHPNIFHRCFSPATSQAKWNPSSLSPQRGTTWLRFLFVENDSAGIEVVSVQANIVPLKVMTCYHILLTYMVLETKKSMDAWDTWDGMWICPGHIKWGHNKPLMFLFVEMLQVTMNLADHPCYWCVSQLDKKRKYDMSIKKRVLGMSKKLSWGTPCNPQREIANVKKTRELPQGFTWFQVTSTCVVEPPCIEESCKSRKPVKLAKKWHHDGKRYIKIVQHENGLEKSTGKLQ